MRASGFDQSKPVLRYRGEVLDGRNRLRAAELAGVEPVFADVSDECDPYVESWKHNGARRDLDPDQKTAIYLKILAASDAWVKEREAAKRKANAGRSEKAKTNVPKQPRGEDGKVKPCPPSREGALGDSKPSAGSATAKAIAEQAGVSRATVERVQRLEREAPERNRPRGNVHDGALAPNASELSDATGRRALNLVALAWGFAPPVTRKLHRFVGGNGRDATPRSARPRSAS
jgi:ParB-like chromosome segregation protein Spo0J